MTGGNRDYLLDVSRLIWRLWSGRLPTGIDRVCLEYVRHYAARSRAVVQFRGRILVFGEAASDRLFALLTGAAEGFRPRLIATLAAGLPSARTAPPRRGMVYLNVGHTGLDDPALTRWAASNDVRAIYLVHDLIPLTHPHYCREGEAARHAKRMENALASAAGIITNSSATLDDLAEFAASSGLPMPPSLSAWISGPDVPANVAPRRLERPHFVALGTIEARKNHLLLLRVWESLVRSLGDAAPILLLVGQRGWEAEEAIAILDNPCALAGHVRELGRCDDEEVAGWLAGAQALLMPSFVEGFGLPIIEAFELGTPVVASDLPVYREIVGDLPAYLDPQDAAVWERAVRDFMDDGSQQRTRQIEALQTYRAPDWPGHFERVDAWLEELLLR